MVNVKVRVKISVGAHSMTTRPLVKLSGFWRHMQRCLIFRQLHATKSPNPSRNHNAQAYPAWAGQNTVSCGRTEHFFLSGASLARNATSAVYSCSPRGIIHPHQRSLIGLILHVDTARTANYQQHAQETAPPRKRCSHSVHRPNAKRNIPPTLAK